MTLIKTYEQWKENGCFWSHGNLNCCIHKHTFDEGSPTANQILIESGSAYKNKESLIKSLSRNCEKVDIARNQFLTIVDCKRLNWPSKYHKIKTMEDVYDYLDKLEPDNEIRERWIPKNSILMRENINKENLEKFDVTICENWKDRMNVHIKRKGGLSNIILETILLIIGSIVVLFCMIFAAINILETFQ